MIASDGLDLLLWIHIYKFLYILMSMHESVEMIYILVTGYAKKDT